MKKKGSDFSITLTANVTTRLRFMKGCSCFAGCCWQLALVWMGRAMYWHQRSSKSWLRKPFGFSKGITRSRYPIPSDFNNHRIASEKLNPSISTNPLEEINLGKSLQRQMSHPLPAWHVKRAGGTDKKIPLCFSKDKKKGQSSQIITSNHSPCRRNTNSIQAATK